MNVSKIVLSAVLLASTPALADQVTDKQAELERERQIARQKTNAQNLVESFQYDYQRFNNTFKTKGEELKQTIRAAVADIESDNRTMAEIREFARRSIQQISESKAGSNELKLKIESVLAEFLLQREKCFELKSVKTYRLAEQLVEDIEGLGLLVTKNESFILGNSYIAESFKGIVRDRVAYIDKTSSDLREHLKKIDKFNQPPKTCVDLQAFAEVVETIDTFNNTILGLGIETVDALRVSIGNLLKSIDDQVAAIEAVRDFNILVTSLETDAASLMRNGEINKINKQDFAVTSTQRIASLAIGGSNISGTLRTQYQELTEKIRDVRASIAAFKTDTEQLEIAIYRKQRAVSRAVRTAIRDRGASFDASELDQSGLRENGSIGRPLSPQNFEEALEVDAILSQLLSKAEGN
ncbi:MAG: hypothetical protein HRU19_11270 [Pseudobacteriovorax sp.]|nr:hypothetical protein [Pseudobacteriovorax sp.]